MVIIAFGEAWRNRESVAASEALSEVFFLNFRS